MTYTKKQVDEAGSLLSAFVAEEMIEQLRATSPYAALFAGQPRPRPTRLTLLRWRVRDYRERVATAMSVLRGTHDCGDDW